jgi:hypothetical protein|tara:strand:- start:192 stop:422 length:231 start_codon:yes stop_codon:yes gene_type:complete
MMAACFNADLVKQFDCPLTGVTTVLPGNKQRHHDILQGREFREQLKKLKNETHFMVAVPSKGWLVHFIQPLSTEDN